MTWDNQTLSIKGPTGKTVKVPTEAASFADNVKEFDANFKGMSPAAEGDENLEWSQTHSYGGYSAVGSAVTVYEDVAGFIASNFALSTDTNGKVHLEVGWESGMNVLGGMMVHFTFAAPTDEAFRAKIGLK